jgi:hypothetical protein
MCLFSISFSPALVSIYDFKFDKNLFTENAADTCGIKIRKAVIRFAKTFLLFMKHA